MEFTRKNIYDNLMPAVLTLISILCMTYAAARLVSILLLPQWSPWFLLLFCAVLGLVRTISICLGQKQLAPAAMAAVALLAMIFFRSRQAFAEITVSVFAYAIFSALQTHNRPRQFFTLAVTAGMTACFVTGRQLPLPLAAAVIFLLLTELAGLPLHPNRDRGLRLTPLLLLLIWAAASIPSSDRPYNWGFVIRIGNEIADAAEDLITELEYRFSRSDVMDRWGSGYGKPSPFGDRFSNDNRRQLSLSDKNTNPLLYLSGQEYAHLSGNRWETAPADGNSFSDWYLLFLKALYTHQITPEEAECFSRIRTIGITYQNLRTKDVIRPSGLLSVDERLMKDMTGDDGSYAFSGSKKKGYSYRVTYMELDYANPYLAEILRESAAAPSMTVDAAGGASGTTEGSATGTAGGSEAGAAGSSEAGSAAGLTAGTDSRMAADSAGSTADSAWPSYDTLDDYSQQLYHLSLRSFIPEADYAARTEAVGNPDLYPYLDAGGIPERAADLARQVTAGYSNDYDRCLAIERYLRQYTYSKTVDYSSYVSYVDAFLFEKQAGFCVHFASSMVVMLQSLGIPARLAEGYCCSFEVQDEDGYPVYGRQAHTWPEAYIRGYGWVPFEPTASIVTYTDYGWNLRVKEPITADPDQTPEEETPALPSQQEQEETLPPPTDAAPSEERPNPFRTLLLFLAAIPAVYALLLAIQPHIKRFLYRRKSDEEKINADLQDILWLIRTLFPSDWKNRPLLDYAEVISDAPLSRAAADLFLMYYRLRYRGGQPDASLWESLQTAKGRLLALYIAPDKRGQIRRRLNAHARLNALPSGFH